MTTTEKTLISVLLALIVLSLVGLMSVGRIHAWEKANNYPFGKLCDVFHNCSR